MLLTLHYAIKLNVDYAWWFFSFIIFHLIFFIYWYFNSLGWDLPSNYKDKIKFFEFTFNPFTGKIKNYTEHCSRYDNEVDDNLRDDLIDTNIPISMNLLIVANVLFGLFYILAFVLVNRRF